jgi:hypothetical protein
MSGQIPSNPPAILLLRESTVEILDASLHSNRLPPTEKRIDLREGNVVGVVVRGSG